MVDAVEKPVICRLAMEVPRLAAFRLYYNTTIHPELLRMERLRRRLLGLLFGSVALMFALLAVVLYFNVALLFMLTLLPIGFYLFYLGGRVQQFRQTFKPRVIRLILDFMSDSLNMRQLDYQSKRQIDWEVFKDSRLFKSSPDYFLGEDYIEGLVGEMPFAMSELQVREISPASNRLQEVFEGVFLSATFPEPNEGQVAIWPRHRRRYLTRTIKEYISEGGINVDHEIMNDAFREQFITYATEETKVAAVLTEPMQEQLAIFAAATHKNIYASFDDQQIYVAISEQKDLLEPYLFRSNRSFDLVREFYQDISLVLKIVEEFDRTH